MVNQLLQHGRAGHDPKVSIIVPFYNANSTLERCLSSLTHQTYGDFEIILIDDGSTDDGGTIAREYAKNDSRIKIVSQGNCGQATARNNGIMKASGAYVCFVDADDYVHPAYLERMTDALTMENCEIAVCNFMKVVRGSRTPEFDPSEDVSFSTVEALAELNYHRRFDSSAGGKMFPKSFFNEVQFPVGMKCEDAAIMHFLIAQCSRLAYIADPLYFYERNDESTTRTKKPSRKFVDDALRAIAIRRSFYESNFPSIMPSMDTESLLSIIYAYGRYSINGGMFPKSELKRMLEEARSYLANCLKDPNVPRSRKIQSLIFCASPRLYSGCYALLSSKRGY